MVAAEWPLQETNQSRAPQGLAFTLKNYIAISDEKDRKGYKKKLLTQPYFIWAELEPASSYL